MSRPLRLALPRMPGTSHIAICDVAGRERRRWGNRCETITIPAQRQRARCALSQYGRQMRERPRLSQPPARGAPAGKRMRNGYDPRTAATRKMRVVPVRPRQARPLPQRRRKMVSDRCRSPFNALVHEYASVIVFGFDMTVHKSLVVWRKRPEAKRFVVLHKPCLR